MVVGRLTPDDNFEFIFARLTNKRRGPAEFDNKSVEREPGFPFDEGI